MNKTGYSKSGSYRMNLVSGSSEAVKYLGKNRQGMVRFEFVATGEVWTGFTANVIEV